MSISKITEVILSDTIIYVEPQNDIKYVVNGSYLTLERFWCWIIDFNYVNPSIPIKTNPTT